MKNKNGSIPTAVLESVTNPIDLVKDIENLTVEDVVVVYAYAEAIVETVREPLIILDEKLRIKTANKSFFDAFKVSKEETYNKLIFDLGNGQWDIPELKKLLKEILPKNSHFEDFEVTHEFDDIGIKTMMLNARRIVLEGHKTELVLLAIEDVTQKKMIAKHKEDFIGIASHELKTPLTSIKMFVQILQIHLAKTADTKSIYMLEKTAKQITRMEHMMASLLNAYKVQSGKLKLQKELFVFDDLITDIIETFQHSTEIHIKIEGKPLGNIYADSEKIGQVLINLLTNAIKYSPRSKKIIITTKKNADTITVSVKDSGMGISKSQQSMVFERFFREENKEEKKIDGLGLGLYISHEIVSEHNGKMWLESALGKGSTFHFSLPLTSQKN